MLEYDLVSSPAAFAMTNTNQYQLFFFLTFQIMTFILIFFSSPPTNQTNKQQQKTLKELCVREVPHVIEDGKG